MKFHIYHIIWDFQICMLKVEYWNTCAIMDYWYKYIFGEQVLYAPIVYVKKGYRMYIEKYQDLISQFRGESMSYFGDFNHTTI